MKHDLIKRLQTTLPRGCPFDLAALASIGISAKLAAHYVVSGWLVRLAQGVYAFPVDTLRLEDTLCFLQQRVPGLHVSGKSALGMQGVRHNLGVRDTLQLWGNERFVVPAWFASRFPARYVSARLFDWPEDSLAEVSLAEVSLTTPPGTTAGLRVSVPERAVLELLYEVGTRQGLEEARNLFDSLRGLRREPLGRLLACCTSVKTVRLFLGWARETGVADADALLRQYPLPVGSDKRWISRLPDGTLLSLRPYG